MYTNPTGFSGVPPAGPAIPVADRPTSTSANRRAPSAIARAVPSLTAPYRSMVSSGTPRSSIFDPLLYVTRLRSK